MKNSKAQPTEELFDSIAKFISDGRVLLEADKMIELAGLDEHVHTLCSAVLQLSQEERLKYADRLQQLLGDLKALGDRMIEKREVLAEEIRFLSQHKKASSAYRVVEASDGFTDKDKE